MTELPDFWAVIFDLDGLVLDTEIAYFAAWQQAASSMGYQCSEAFCQSLSGLQYADVEQCFVATYGEHFNLQAFASHSAQCWRNVVEQQGIPVKPGFQQLLDLLKQLQIPYALATNSPQLNALECLALAGLKDIFTTLIAREHVQKGKPAPDIFFHAAQHLTLPIQQCLVLEDSYNGVLGAYRAGARVIYIPSTQSSMRQAEVLATCTLKDLVQLAELIECKFFR
jgi:beta-phosphoglucomutase